MSNITLFAADFAPKSWSICNGSLLAINTNQALFALLGTTYGGNGTTTFALPDLRGRVPVGTGNGAGLTPCTLGEMGGVEGVTMLSTNLPQHNHPTTVTIQMPVNTTAGITDGPDGSVYAVAPASMYNSTAGAGQFTGAIHVAANLQPAGSSQPIPNLMPYTALNYIICLYGIFPSRN